MLRSFGDDVCVALTDRLHIDEVRTDAQGRRPGLDEIGRGLERDSAGRDDLDLRKGYLLGRFGAIPFTGDLRQLNWDTYAETEQQ